MSLSSISKRIFAALKSRCALGAILFNVFILSLITLSTNPPLSAEAQYQIEIPAQPVGIPEGYEVVGDLLIPVSTDRFTFQRRPWTNNVVPYVFNSDVKQINRERTLVAMREWETASGVRFIPHTTESNYLKIVNGSGNYATLGMVGGEQTLHMKDWDNGKFLLIHELGHTLGMLHEHQRPDRDNYIKVHYQNMLPASYFNFDILPGTEVVGPYDFHSIMHYGSKNESINGNSTIEMLPPYIEFQKIIDGPKQRLGNGDRNGVLDLYPGVPLSPGDTRDYPIDILYLMQLNTFSDRIATTTATISSDDPIPSCSSGRIATRTTWFSFETIHYYYESNIVTLGVNARGYDNTLTIYEDTLLGLKELACFNNDSVSDDGTRYISLPIGQRYFIMVSSADSGGNLKFDAALDMSNTVPTLPVADDFSEAITIDAPVFSGVIDTSLATVAHDDPIPSCVSFPEDLTATVWFKIHPTQDVRTVLSAEGYETLAAVWTGERGSLTEVACLAFAYQGVEGSEIPLSSGTTYYIMVAGDYESGMLAFHSRLLNENYLTNGDLEDQDGDKVPDGWMVRNSTKDKSKCNKANKYVSKSGLCAFRFTGTAASKVHLEQAVNVSGNQGDKLTFRAWAKNKDVALKHKLKIKFNFISGGTATKSKLLLRPQDLAEYRIYQTHNLVAPSNFDQIAVSIQFGGSSGKLFLDDLFLSSTVELAQPDQLLPLP